MSTLKKNGRTKDSNEKKIRDQMEINDKNKAEVLWKKPGGRKPKTIKGKDVTTEVKTHLSDSSVHDDANEDCDDDLKKKKTKIPRIYVSSSMTKMCHNMIKMLCSEYREKYPLFPVDVGFYDPWYKFEKTPTDPRIFLKQKNVIVPPLTLERSSFNFHGQESLSSIGTDVAHLQQPNESELSIKKTQKHGEGNESEEFPTEKPKWHDSFTGVSATYGSSTFISSDEGKSSDFGMSEIDKRIEMDEDFYDKFRRTRVKNDPDIPDDFFNSDISLDATDALFVGRHRGEVFTNKGKKLTKKRKQLEAKKENAFDSHIDPSGYIHKPIFAGIGLEEEEARILDKIERDVRIRYSQPTMEFITIHPDEYEYMGDDREEFEGEGDPIEFEHHFCNCRRQR